MTTCGGRNPRAPDRNPERLPERTKQPGGTGAPIRLVLSALLLCTTACSGGARNAAKEVDGGVGGPGIQARRHPVDDAGAPGSEGGAPAPTGPESDAAGSSDAADAGEPAGSSDAADAGEPPLDVTVATDARSTVSDRYDFFVGTTLETTGPNGVKYRVQIPAKALPLDATITLAPVTDLGGYPFAAGFAGAVQLLPEGTTF